MSESEKLIRANSILAALFIAETNICTMLATFISIPKVSVVLMILIMLLIFFYNRKFIRIQKRVISFYVLLLILLLLSSFINGFKVAGERVLYYLTFATTAMLIVSICYNKKKIFDNLMLIYGLHLLMYFFIQRNNILNSDDFWLIQMGIAYGFVPSILISSSYLLNINGFIMSEKKSKIKLLIIVSVFILSCYVVILDCGTRGALIACIIGFFLLVWKTVTIKQKRLLILIMTILIIIVYVKLDSVIYYSLDVFSENNVKSLNKLSRMVEDGDVSNGRDILYMSAKEMIKNNPILGYGVGYFENQTKSAYVHQFFLEVLCEFGIWGFCLIVLPIVKFFRSSMKEKNVENYTFKIVIFSISTLPLLFSTSYWLFPLFWLCYFMAISKDRTSPCYV